MKNGPDEIAGNAHRHTAYLFEHLQICILKCKSLVMMILQKKPTKLDQTFGTDSNIIIIYDFMN